jgi:hypothetical protein
VTGLKDDATSQQLYEKKWEMITWLELEKESEKKTRRQCVWQ